jgi:hypothetical protein
LEKVVDDSALEGSSLINDFIGDLQLLGNELGNPNLAAASFLPFLGDWHRFILVFPDL